MFGMKYMNVKQLENRGYEVSIPVITRYDIENRFLVEQAQRMFTTGILVTGFSLNTTKYGIINDECYVIGQVTKDVRVAVNSLSNYLISENITKREDILAAIMAMISACNLQELSDYVYKSSRKTTQKRIIEMDNSIFDKMYRMLPTSNTGIETVKVIVDEFHLQAMRPINYNLKNDIEIWQSVNYTVRCGLYIARAFHNVEKADKALLLHIILAILHISQQTMGMISK